tara:strand:+ start:10424 stop:12130 length:1707 start_codon:yes stop_codon:yes gene_type:complete
MNKTVTINISGIIFNIDEEAFKQLSQYLDTIKGYFNTSEGRDEIMADIEARIAEMFQEKLNEKNQVVSIKDVDKVIAIMGEPEDYIDEEIESESFNSKANYEKVTTTGSSRFKRLYRDGEDRVMGGVCAGIAHYFGVDPIIPRILFIISFFGFGTGFLAYIILWIIVPEAKSTAEKLQMKGEHINIENIKKSVENEAENFKNKFKDFRNSDTAKKPIEKVGAIFETFFSLLANLLSLILKSFGKIIGIFFIFIGSVAVIGLIGGLLGSSRFITAVTSGGVVSYSMTDLAQVFFNDSITAVIGIVGASILIGIPFILLLLGGFKLLLGSRVNLKGYGLGAIGLWIIGMIAAFYALVATGTDFSNKGRIDETLNINQTNYSKLIIKSKTPTDYNRYKEKFNGHFDSNDHDGVFRLTEDKVYLGFTHFTIEESLTDSFVLEVMKSARGDNFEEASERADKINFTLTQFDSILNIDPLYWFDKNANWRLQQVKFTLYVPEGKSVYLDASSAVILDDVPNYSDTWDRDMVNKTWTMIDGELRCLKCEEKENKSKKRYKNENSTEVSEIQQIES